MGRQMGPTLLVVMPMLHGKTTLARAFPGVAVDVDDLYAAQGQSWRDKHRALVMRQDWTVVSAMENLVVEGAIAAHPTGRVILLHNDTLRADAGTPWIRETARWRAINPLRLGDVLHRARQRVGPITTAQEAATGRGLIELAVRNWRAHLDRMARWTAEGVPILEHKAILSLIADRDPSREARQ